MNKVFLHISKAVAVLSILAVNPVNAGVITVNGDGWDGSFSWFDNPGGNRRLIWQRGELGNTTTSDPYVSTQVWGIGQNYGVDNRLTGSSEYTTSLAYTVNFMSDVVDVVSVDVDYAFRNVYEISAYGTSGQGGEYGSVETIAALSIENALTGDPLFADNRFKSASGTNVFSETEVSKSTILSFETNIDYIVNLSAYVWVYWAPIGPSSIADVYGLAYADPVFSIDQALANDVSIGFSLPFDINNHEYTDGSVLEPVPVPGSVWLLGSGLIALVSVGKKFKK